MSEPCPLCNRQNEVPSDHHLIPQCRGGGEKVTVCRDCHNAMHSLFSNKELESKYNTVESLMADDRFAKMVRFISRQKGKVTMKLANDQRRRGRNG